MNHLKNRQTSYYSPIPIIILLLGVLLFSCDSGEDIQDPNVCSEIVDLKLELKFPDDLPVTLTYVNVNNAEQKSYIYDAIESGKTFFKDTILCTYLDYISSVNMEYKDNSSSDIMLINYSRNYDFNFSQEFNESVTFRSGIFKGKTIDVARMHSIDQNLFFDDVQNRLIYFGNYFIPRFIDYLDGDSWVLKGTETAPVFCQSEHYLNFNLRNNELALFDQLSQKRIKFDSGEEPYEFDLSFINSQSSYYPVKESLENCATESLRIRKLQSNYFIAEHPSGLKLYQTVFSLATANDRYELSFVIRIEEDEFSEDLVYKFQFNPFGLEGEFQFGDIENEVVFHASIDIDGQEYLDVFELTKEDRTVYFSMNLGIVSFQNKVGDFFNRVSI